MAVVRGYQDLGRFSRKEISSILLFTFVFVIVLTVKLWFKPEATLPDIVFSTGVVFFGMLISVLLHEGGHAYVASRMGYKIFLRHNPVGLVIGLVVSLYTFGGFPLITPNVFRADARPDLRLDKFYRYDNPKHVAIIAGGGLLGSTIAIILFSTLRLMTNSELVGIILLGSILHAVYSLIPWELISFIQLRFSNTIKQVIPGDGLHLIWAGGNYWIFGAVFIGVFVALASFAHIATYIISLILAIIASSVYKIYLSN